MRTSNSIRRRTGLFGKRYFKVSGKAQRIAILVGINRDVDVTAVIRIFAGPIQIGEENGLILHQNGFYRI